MTEDAQFPVLGLDVGGTRTRALLVTTGGERIGSATAAGGNPAAHGAEVAAARVGEAVAAALAGTDPGLVRGCVVGLAGASKYAAEPETAGAFERTWRRAGLTCPVHVVSDIAVAYATGTVRPTGSILLAGTGAVAAEVRDREPVWIHDGYGWLLGDDGSGYWIGREAVRATLAAVDGRAAMTALPRLVLARYCAGTASAVPGDGAVSGGNGAQPVHGGLSIDAGLRRAERRIATALVQAVTNQPTVALANLAPLVMQAYAGGDPAAGRIVRRAASMLVSTLSQARPAASDAPIVLAGAVLAAPTPVRDLVVDDIARRWPRARVTVVRDGAAGAAWLAALPHLPDAGPDGPASAAAALHARLLR